MCQRCRGMDQVFHGADFRPFLLVTIYIQHMSCLARLVQWTHELAPGVFSARLAEPQAAQRPRPCRSRHNHQEMDRHRIRGKKQCLSVVQVRFKAATSDGTARSCQKEAQKHEIAVGSRHASLSSTELKQDTALFQNMNSTSILHQSSISWARPLIIEMRDILHFI
jgi:hypothetical protein